MMTTKEADDDFQRSASLSDPDFQEDVEDFQVKTQPRNARMTALVLGILSLAAIVVGVVFFMRGNDYDLKKAEAPDDTVLATVVSMLTVEEHAVPEDCWLAIHGNVYDLTEYALIHPGEPTLITRHCGTDATKWYDFEHTKALLPIVDEFVMGTLEVIPESILPTSAPILAGVSTANPTEAEVDSNPTVQPTSNPTAAPTFPAPTKSPTVSPTNAPSPLPSSGPTAEPTTSEPTRQPTLHPTRAPIPPTETASPTKMPTPAPSPAPTIATTAPTSTPTSKPTSTPTEVPTSKPTPSPTQRETPEPTPSPVEEGCTMVSTDKTHLGKLIFDESFLKPSLLFSFFQNDVRNNIPLPTLLRTLMKILVGMPCMVWYMTSPVMWMTTKEVVVPF